ncbi:MAG: DUF5309 family protein [Phycisphaerales bacterium]|nr:DUF5309 family protein [Phycisphaerales bacterium]
MPFTGKATFTAAADLPELVEDVADIISIVSPFETPLLDHLGDAKRAATSTIHEWMEDALLPNTDQINQSSFAPGPTTATGITVDNGDRFRVGDQVRPEAVNSREVMFVTGVAGALLTVVRGYGGTTPAALADNMRLTIIASSALEGDDRPSTRFTNRARKRNYTQIFTAPLEVSGTMRAARAYGAADELDFQKQERLREMLRDLENAVINGVAPSANQQGTNTTRRTMGGIIRTITTNNFTPNSGGIPAAGASGELIEPVLNAAMRLIWEQSSGKVDTILVGGVQKRRINEFVSSARQYVANDIRYREMLSVYESDFGVCQVVMSRWIPPDAVLLLDSSRIDVLPLAGRSFHFKPLSSPGDSDVGMLIGEYTTEMRNENAHGVIRNLAA